MAVNSGKSCDKKAGEPLLGIAGENLRRWGFNLGGTMGNHPWMVLTKAA